MKQVGMGVKAKEKEETVTLGIHREAIAEIERLQALCHDLQTECEVLRKVTEEKK